MFNLFAIFNKRWVNLAPLALAFASLGNVWSSIVPLEYAYRVMCFFSGISLSLILYMVIKDLCSYHWQFLFAKRPFANSLVIVCTMGSMVNGHNLYPFFPLIAHILWYLGVLFHLYFCMLFFKNEWLNRNGRLLEWLNTCAGLMMASSTFVDPNEHSFASILFVLGMAIYLIKIPTVLACIIRFRKRVRQLLIALGAPASLALCGYLATIQQLDFIFVTVLLPLALLTTFLVYINFFYDIFCYKQCKYLAAYTFPATIGASAQLDVKNWSSIFQNFWFFNVSEITIYIESLIATFIVIYVALKYIKYQVDLKNP